MTRFLQCEGQERAELGYEVYHTFLRFEASPLPDRSEEAMFFRAVPRKSLVKVAESQSILLLNARAAALIAPC